MSRAFVKESEGEWLGDVAPEIGTLERYLTRENGEQIFVVRKSFDKAKNREVFEMDSGSSYPLNSDNRWEYVS